MDNLLVHSGKHPFDIFDYTTPAGQALTIFGNNSGNLLFAEAVFKYLYTSPSRNLRSDGYRFLSHDADMAVDVINERYDAFVIPAANWLAPHFRQFLRPLAVKIRQLKIPCIVVGLGVQSNTRQNFDCLKGFAGEAKEFLAAVSEKSHSISVRGEFTAACLQRLGFRNVNVTGCPSFYRNLGDFAVSNKIVPREKFALAVNGSLLLLEKLHAYLFDAYPSSVLFSQADPLRAMSLKWRMPWRELKRWLGDGFSLRLISEGKVKCYGDVTPWMVELEKFHFALGTRIHGNIIALLSGIPATVVTHDSRTEEMAEFYKIPTVPLRSLDKAFDPYELYERVDCTEMQSEYPAKLANMARFFEDNGLTHTLFEKSGLTFYDRTVLNMNFGTKSFSFDDPFFRRAGKLAPAFTGLKALKRRIRASST